MSNPEKVPLINWNPVLQQYYASWESRIGYRLLLGGTRHFGYYANPTSSAIPISPSLRAMEAQLLHGLHCPKGSRVLDAGCGVGHVALYMVEHGGYKIDCIDVVSRHIVRARKNIRAAGMEKVITAHRGDYHHLEEFEDGSFDGIYTMETLVHSTDPLKVLREFLRILKPGGRVALNEYDHIDLDKAPKNLADSMRKVNKYAAMPANASFEKDVLKDLLQEAGFRDVELRDMSKHIVPMLWLFYIIAIVPYLIFQFLGIEHHFVNTVAGVESYQGRSIWRYIQVTGRKAP